MVITILGASGALLLAGCSLPLLWDTIKAGHCRGVSKKFLAAWWLGEILTLVYVLLLPQFSWSLFINYAVNTLAVGVVCVYKVWPRVKTLEEMVREFRDG